MLRHGAHPDVLEFPLVRGCTTWCSATRTAISSARHSPPGVAVLLTGIALFQYKGAFFWKMTAGMGDVVIAPLYQALRRRGVEFEFFHRVDALHLDDRHQRIDAITMGRQVRLADGVDHYEPLTTGPTACRYSRTARWPNRSRPEAGIEDLESHFGKRDDVETRVLRRGVDFDHVVLAVSLGMVELVAQELIADSPEWRDMTTHVRTVATQAFQLWLRPDESALGWDSPGVTTSGYVAPFDTWASMPQTLWAEEWPDARSPTDRGVLLRGARRGVADHRRPRGLRRPVPAAGADPSAVDYLDQPCRAVPARCGDRRGVRVASARPAQTATGARPRWRPSTSA